MALSKVEVKNELWRRCELRFKMHSVQKEMYDLYLKSGPRSTSVWLLSRQTGKSYCLALLALVAFIQIPFSIVYLLTDTKLHVQTIF